MELKAEHSQRIEDGATVPVSRLFSARPGQPWAGITVRLDRRPPTADRRPPTADRRPPTADRRPPTADRRAAWSGTGRSR
ncbi:hypothetical protein [Micromonospora sp.]|uniref:hypothetical protein n=1 Tax=Micromonospora sp. TaxID=1876 RepID=UPI003B3BCB41